MRKFFIYEVVTSKVRSVAFDFGKPKKLENLITEVLIEKSPDISMRFYYL